MESAKKMDPDMARMLSETGYSDKAIRYLEDTPGLGILENADHVTDLVGPCGDSMKLSLDVDGGIIRDARIQVLGCPGAIASGCALVSLAKGRSMEDARKLTIEDLYAEVERLPEKKIHCARLVLKTLHKAVDEYVQKQTDKGERK
ncbi:MAG: iron-sulfur cluster assembly scaffold protein [Deltaproteobacteria bacterium]|nr:iron-sulfur cluster assembly scaffold protein [Deltaproteobacteria bacterium]